MKNRYQIIKHINYLEEIKVLDYLEEGNEKLKDYEEAMSGYDKVIGIINADTSQ